jgi:hypothetical protein
MRLVIHRPLAFDALDRFGGAQRVDHTECDPVRIAEVELGEIAVKVLFGAVLIDALDATLEDLVVAFNGVGCNDFVALAADVFVFRVVDGSPSPLQNTARTDTHRS